ncbi:MAG TPA: cytochrome c [Burkholderiales bacterium]|nr:cytochrome c [Burkholderiales bacterium]
MKTISAGFTIIVLTGAAHAALPGDAAAGKRLHDTYCTGCHNTSVYTRKDRSIQSLDALQAQLKGCSHMAGKELSAAEARDLLKYLNDQFYRLQ